MFGGVKILKMKLLWKFRGLDPENRSKLEFKPVKNYSKYFLYCKYTKM